MSRKGVLVIALLTLIIFGGSGLVLIYYLHKGDMVNTFFPEWQHTLLFYHLGLQTAIGSVYGLVSAVLLWRLVEINYLKPTRRFFTRLIGGIELKGSDILIISLCAGIGEELFFRGAVQPWLGIWLTSILFVAIHGYLSPANRPLALYGLCMTVVIAGVGYMARHYGLISAMVAHTLIDVYLFFRLRQNARLSPDLREQKD